MSRKTKVVLAVTGASGAIYARELLIGLQKVSEQLEEVAWVMSDNARSVWERELGDRSYESFPFKRYEKNDFMAPFASGSARFTTMIICPCSMGTLGRIASGISNDLITRAADVMLKERRKLVLVTRETPLNLIHLNNMKTVTEAGGIICPATPSFYHRPADLTAVTRTVTDRVLDLCGLDINTERWQEGS